MEQVKVNNTLGALKESVKEDLQTIHTLFDTKSAQYHSNKDELANFRQGSNLEYGDDTYEHMFSVAKMYLLKHISMLYSSGAFTKHNMDESLMDIAIYALIMRHMIKQGEKENEQN